MAEIKVPTTWEIFYCKKHFVDTMKAFYDHKTLHQVLDTRRIIFDKISDDKDCHAPECENPAKYVIKKEMRD